MHWAFNFVRLRYQTVGWCLLPYYTHSIIWYDFQNIKFLDNMQCVIEISEKKQKNSKDEMVNANRNIP